MFLAMVALNLSLFFIVFSRFQNDREISTDYKETWYMCTYEPVFRISYTVVCINKTIRAARLKL